MDKDRLDDFGAYRKANELFELVADDMTSLASNPLCVRLIGQQIAAADSIGANIDEGYGRGSRKEFAQYLLIARSSAREVRGRYVRMKRWLNPDVVEARCALASEIIAILTATAKKLRK
ncbi:MAG TPA: four helix bundle protein [Chthoniobacter sp.]|jgi:four helix bundle protein